MIVAGRSGQKEAERERQVRWLKWVLERTGLTPSGLGNASGASDQTLTRFLNQPDYRGLLSTLTIRMIVEHTGLPGPDGWEQDVKAGRFGFSEGSQFNYETATGTPGLGQAIRLLLGNRPGAAPWELHTKALEAAGYLPGDLVVVDLNQIPRPHDAVCAQIYDLKGGAETVFRIWEPPILTGATFDPAERPRPLVVDNVAVKIMGVITHMVRAPLRS